MRVDQLDAALQQLAAAGTPAKLIYVSPTFHNPTGITMPLARRHELLQVAARRGVLILEDTAYNELYFGTQLVPTLAALAQGHFVLTAGTFSKVIAPGLRVGWLQARPELLRRLLPARFDMGNSPLQHRMLHEFMVSGELAGHLAGMRVLYRSKMQALAGALRDACGDALQFTEPDGGFFLWLRLAAPLRAQEVQERALARGVVFPVGRGFFPAEGPRPPGEYLRLAYSRAGVTDLRAAAERLAGLLAGRLNCGGLPAPAAGESPATALARGLRARQSSGGRCSAHGQAASNAAAAPSTARSARRRPTICRPTGRPAAVNPHGTVAAGCPVTLNG